jgi:hypothetical protein
MWKLLETQAGMPWVQERLRYHVEGPDQFRASKSEEETGSEGQEKSARTSSITGNRKFGIERL